MKAIAKNSNGEIREFEIYLNKLDCRNRKLTELNISNGVKVVYCYGNQLKELKLPNGIKKVACSNNQLTELNLPNGVKDVYCFNNPIKEITLPNSINNALLPLNCIVLNLDEFRNRNDVTINFR